MAPPDRATAWVLLAFLAIAALMGWAVLGPTSETHGGGFRYQPLSGGVSLKCYWAVTIGTDATGYRERGCHDSILPAPESLSDPDARYFCSIDPLRPAPRNDLRNCPAR